MKIPIILIVVIGVIGGGFYYFAQNNKTEGIACTMEAKICPDGSYVGRTGPKCEFSQCPVPNTDIKPLILQTSIGQKVNGLDVALTPLKVMEDSRCAVDVQCIWAGTIKVQTKIQSGLGESIMIFEPNKPITTEAETITLTEVAPAPRSTETIKPADYRFTFQIEKR